MKKRLLAGLMTASMLAMALTACGSAETQTASETEAAHDVSEVNVSEGDELADTITIARAGAVTSLDPVMVSYTNDIQIIELICEQLVTTNDEGTEIIPDLAESWDISEDGLTYTFHIIPDLKFSDGNPVTEEDWEFSIERAMTTEESPWAFAAANIASVEVPDTETVIITLKDVAANTLSNLSCFSISLQEKAQYDATSGYTEGDIWPIGTNSYAVSENVSDDHITLTANEYFHGDAPLTKEIVFKTVTDDNSRIMMLEAHEVDIVTDLPYSNMEEIDAEEGLISVGLPSTGNKYIVLNETSNDALAVKEVREALLYATDKQMIVDMVLFGYGEPAVSFMPANGLYYDDEIEAAEYDVEKAKELLAEGGYPDGFELEVLVPSGNSTYTSIATILKDLWSQIGVELTITSLDQAALYDQEYAMEHEMLFGSWSDDIADPSQLADYWFNFETSQGFFTGYENAEAQAIFEESQYETDETAREALYHQLQEIFYDDVVAINMYHQQITVAMSEDIQGYVETPLYAFRFDQLVKVSD